MAEAVPGLTCILRLIKGRTFGCGASHFNGTVWYKKAVGIFYLMFFSSQTPTEKMIIDEIYFKLFLLAMLPKLWLFKTSNKHALFYAGPLLADNAE